MKRDNADWFSVGGLGLKDFEEEASDLLEVADQIAAGALAGGGEEFEIGGLDSQPGVGGCGGESEEWQDGPCQRQAARGTHHDEECSTGGTARKPGVLR
jgi:hypothetical protein